MSVFEYILTLITLVIGLGLTRILNAVAALEFQIHRRQEVVDLAWLTSIIILQVDYWFSLWDNENSREVWDLWYLVYAFTLAAFLFLAGAYFAQASSQQGDERWRKIRFGLATITLYFTTSIVGAVMIFGRNFGLGVLLPYAILVPVFFTKNRPRLFELTTSVFLAFSIFVLVFLGPTSIG